MVAWISLAVAAVALLWTIYRDIRQRSALGDETRERKAADEREERRREEELELLRRRLDRDEHRDRDEQAARLVGEHPGRTERLEHQGIDYPIRVRNLGQAPAEDVHVWLAERLPEGGHGGMATPQRRLGALLPGDEWHQCDLLLPLPLGGGVPRAGVIVAMWTDGNGEHRDVEIGDVTLER